MTESNVTETTMVVVSQGDFLMGSASGTKNESPVHPVWVDAFAIAKYPVTRRAYAHFLAVTNHPPPRYWQTPAFQNPDQPVVAASWNDACAYCNWLSHLTGKPYRLPTEAEREKASRGNLEGHKYPWGNPLPEDHKGGCDTPLEPVGSEGPNGFGLFDMSAGVHEWCLDYYSPAYYDKSPYRNPTGPASGLRRVARGGSWRHAIRFARCAARSSLAPEKQFSDFGFRCALSLEV